MGRRLVSAPGEAAPLTVNADFGVPPRWQPLLELGKLVGTLLIGVLVTTVHRPSSRDRLVARAAIPRQADGDRR